MLSEDAAQEVEALTAIMGDDFHLHNETDKSAFVICIAPEADDTSEVVGALALAVSIPLDYPQSASPQFAVSDLQQYAHYFPNRTVNYSSFAPTAAQVATVEALITTAITDLKGEAVVYEAVTAAREWLAANTLAAKPAVDVSDDAALARALDAADVSEDDLELDSEDVDEEMIEALREGKIAGAALDVTTQEPLPEGHPLYAMTNVLLSFHTADLTDDYFDLTLQVFAQHLRAYAGEPVAVLS